MEWSIVFGGMGEVLRVLTSLHYGIDTVIMLASYVRLWYRQLYVCTCACQGEGSVLADTHTYTHSDIHNVHRHTWLQTNTFKHSYTCLHTHIRTCAHTETQTYT